LPKPLALFATIYVSDFQTTVSLADPKTEIEADFDIIPSIFPDRKTCSEPDAAKIRVDNFSTAGALKEINIDVLLLDLLTETTTNV
jgi:hypothetical protein